MKYKFYEDDKFTYIKIFEGKFKGNYVYIPRAKTHWLVFMKDMGDDEE